MTSLPQDATTLQWRVAWLLILAAACSFVGTVPSILANEFYFSWVSTGVLVALAGLQVHFAVKQTRISAPDRFRRWMPWLTIGLYALGLVTVGFGVFGLSTTVAST